MHQWIENDTASSEDLLQGYEDEAVSLNRYESKHSRCHRKTLSKQLQMFFIFNSKAQADRLVKLLFELLMLNLCAAKRVSFGPLGTLEIQEVAKNRDKSNPEEKKFTVVFKPSVTLIRTVNKYALTETRYSVTREEALNA